MSSWQRFVYDRLNDIKEHLATIAVASAAGEATEARQVQIISLIDAAIVGLGVLDADLDAANVTLNSMLAQLGVLDGDIDAGNTVLSSILAQLLAGIIAFPTPYAAGAEPIAASSGNVANAVATATIPAVAAKLAYLSGFQITGVGSTLGSTVSISVTGTKGSALSFAYRAGGLSAANEPLIVALPFPMPASAANIAISVSCPALGGGNTHNAVNALGFYLPA